MKYQKTNMTSGAWAKASELGNIKRAKIVSEANKQPSQFFNKDNSVKMQDVAKIRFDGLPDALNVSLNRATINGLIDAFGDDSVNWQNHYLTVETEKVRVAGKAVVALYLIPEGYKRMDDENGFAVIVKEGTKVSIIKDEDIPIINEEGESQIDLKDIPF